MKKQLILFIALLAVTFILYIPALKNEFNDWDDAAYVTSNPNIELTKENIVRSFTQGEHHRMYAPITALSHSIVYTLFGLNPKPYILVNIFIHLCNTLLLFLFLSQLVKKPLVPLIAAALFALHPMQVESVAYVSGRRDVLYVFFYLISLIYYVKYTTKGKNYIVEYLLSLVFAVLALLSKGQALTLPFSLILISLFTGVKWNSKKFWLDKIPFLILTAIFAVKVFSAPQFASGNYLSTAYVDSDIPFFYSIIYACYGFVQYIILLIFPYRLSLIHPYPEVAGAYVIPYYMYIYIAILAGLIFAFFRFAVKRKLFWFGFTFFAINIAMLLQIIPNSYGIMNDHYVYFSGIGIFLIITDKIAEVMNHRKWSTLIAIFFSVYLVVLCGLSYQRIGAFKDSIKLWSDVITKYPDHYMAYSSRANVNFNQGFFENAIIDYKRSIELNPENYALYVNLGSVYSAAQQYKNAVIAFTKSLNHKPTSEAYTFRADAYSALGNTNDAIRDYNNAIELKPDYAVAYNNRGVVYEKMAETEKAMQDYKKAFDLDSTNIDACYNCAKLYGNNGNFEKALYYLDKLIVIKPDFAAAYNSKGIIFATTGSYEAAILCFSSAIENKPDYAEAYNNRGSVYYRTGKFDLAIADYTRAAEIFPGFAETFNNRGAAYIALDKKDSACSDFTIAAQLGLDSAKENLDKFCN